MPGLRHNYFWHESLRNNNKSNAMLYTMKSTVNPDVLKENMLSIQQFLRETYKYTRQHLQDGVTFFKDEFTALQNRAGQRLNRMQSPVNNFLKDDTRIATELKHELKKDPEEKIFFEGRMVPVKEVITRNSEENY